MIRHVWSGLLLLCAGPVAAAELVCPEALTVRPQVTVEAPAGWQAGGEAEQHYLRGARLFDGPPKDLAELIGEKGGWDLLPNEGRGYTLICQYETTEATLEAVVPAGRKRCQISRRKVDWHGLRYGRMVTDGTEVLVRCR